MRRPLFFCFFFFNDTATTEIYTLSLHDALPICQQHRARHAVLADLFKREDLAVGQVHAEREPAQHQRRRGEDRKSTRLNSSHQIISYAVFCLKKKRLRDSFNRVSVPVECTQSTQ